MLIKSEVNILRKCLYNALGVREWLFFNANSAIFQLYHGELIFNEMMMRSALFTSDLINITYLFDIFDIISF
jgi:hypothetical protein